MLLGINVENKNVLRGNNTF